MGPAGADSRGGRHGGVRVRPPSLSSRAAEVCSVPDPPRTTRLGFLSDYTIDARLQRCRPRQKNLAISRQVSPFTRRTRTDQIQTETHQALRTASTYPRTGETTPQWWPHATAHRTALTAPPLLIGWGAPWGRPSGPPPPKRSILHPDSTLVARTHMHISRIQSARPPHL
jgi:hypothetical protein